MRVEPVTYDGFNAYRLSTHIWEAICVPERGANIAEFTHLETGKQWLWVNPRQPLARHDYGCPYGWGSASGFDECFPAIAPDIYPFEPYRGREIPDHGELWPIAWEAEVSGGSLRTWVEGRAFAYRFERTISDAQDGGMLLQYRLTNLADAPFTYNWSSHPVFAASKGMLIDLGHGTTMRVEGSPGDWVGTPGTRFSWPGEHNLDKIPDCKEGEPRVVKLFAEKVTRNRASLYHPETDSHLTVRFDLSQIDTVGIWINVCHAPSEDCVAIEPCKGNTDSLTGSIAEGTASTLPARGVHKWSLRLSFGKGSGLKD